MEIDSIWLPKCLAHVTDLSLDVRRDRIVIGQITSRDRNGYTGDRKLHTALVPIDRLNDVLLNNGGINWGIEFSGDYKNRDDGDKCAPEFWIAGPDRNVDKFEPVVIGWEQHNHTVLMPSYAILRCFMLCPRIIGQSNEIVWDDLNKPARDVIVSKPLSKYEDLVHSGAAVSIRRTYLEEYAVQKRCAVVGVYYEYRKCEFDAELDSMLGDTEAKEYLLPGRTLSIRRSIIRQGEFICQIWGCHLILSPGESSEQDSAELELEWPGFSGAMTRVSARSKTLSDLIYVSDALLDDFEGKPEYSTNPMSGSVAYDGIWALSYSKRFARDYIAYEIKKLYEGCSDDIIRHVHKYAVEKNVVESQQRELEDINVGIRADRLISTIMGLGGYLAQLSSKFGLILTVENFLGFDPENVRYHGWWTLEGFKEIGYRVPLSMKRDGFFERCKTLYKLFDGMKESAFRSLVNEIGVKDKNLDRMRTMQLLAIIVNLCKMSASTGLDIVSNRAEIIRRLDRNIKIEEMTPLFALVDLRNIASHGSVKDRKRKVRNAFDAYGIIEKKMSAGWGIASDKIYDGLTNSLASLSEILDV